MILAKIISRKLMRERFICLRSLTVYEVSKFQFGKIKFQFGKFGKFISRNQLRFFVKLSVRKIFQNFLIEYSNL